MAIRLRLELALSDAIQLTFFGHPLMRLRGTFNLVLEVVAFGRQQLCDLIDAARTARAKQPRRVIYRLADLELVASHGNLLFGDRSDPPTYDSTGAPAVAAAPR